jgi:hypothetical protein
MTRTRLLDEPAWRAACAALPGALREVYPTPAYHAVCAGWERAEPRCLRAETGGGWMLYPYLAHPAGEDASGAGGAWDAQTAYGYGGPLFVGDASPAERAAALVEVSRGLRDAGAVAEFVRCHTEWVDLAALSAAGYRTFQVRTNVECDLTAADFESAWAPAARRNLRKARAGGLAARAGAGRADWAAFARLYALTAARLDMAAGYRFDDFYFTGLSHLPEARLVLVETPTAATAAGAIVFVGGRLAHYHLGASDFAFQEWRPNDLLYHAMATTARDAGCERIVWGGGMSNDPADSLLRFKTHFGAVRRPVYCAGRVIDAAGYGRLCAAWQARNPGRESKLFLRYRA